MVDTKTINGARYMYIGSELVPTIKAMADPFGNQAFMSVEKYAAGGNIATGEIGSIDQFRIIVVPEMQMWKALTLVIVLLTVTMTYIQCLLLDLSRLLLLVSKLTVRLLSLKSNMLSLVQLNHMLAIHTEKQDS